MYGLPKDIDLQFFNARELLQVCVGANEIILNFDDDLSLTIESGVMHRSASGAEMHFDDTASAANALLPLLCGTVRNAERIEQGTLRVNFSNGESIDVPDSNPDYECYQIRHGALLIVV